MTKIIVVWLALMVSYSLVIGKEASEKLEERIGTAENIKSENDQDESASIQVVHRDTTTDKVKLSSDETSRKEEHSSELIHNTNLTEAKDAKQDTLFENLNNTDEDILENRDNTSKEAISLISNDTIEKKSEHSDEKEQIAAIAGGTSNEDDNNRKEEVFEDIMNSGTPDEIDQIDSSLVDENESNNWRSAENIHSGSKENSKEKAAEKSVTEEDDRDASVEDFTDKRTHLEVKDRMEVRKPDIKEHIENKRPMNPRRHYRPSEEHSISEPGHVRYGEIIVPRYRPVLTRTGIIYTPTMFSMQPGSSLLDRLAGRSWLQNRHLMQEPEVYNTPRPNRVNAPQYEETKMIDDYNDYGSNTYSYTPTRKVTTQAPPQQIPAPKFDIFQKLVDASNHPKTSKRFNENPANYHTQRHHSDIYRPFDVRRTR